MFVAARHGSEKTATVVWQKTRVLHILSYNDYFTV